MSILVSNLTKTYGKQNAVDDISFEVKTGEILGFLGPNGAGKSTTMKIATGYLSPSHGDIEVCGHSVLKNSMEVRRNIGYLPEHNPLYLDMYVKEYLQFIAELHQVARKKRRERVATMINTCGLEREQSKKIGALSKGYRQRVGLAQALIHNPPVLILDEPTTGLDPNQIVEIRQLIKEVGKEKTVIFSTHIMQEVQAICDRAIIINLGKIVANSDIEGLKNLQKSENVLIVEFEKAADIDKIKELEHVIEVKALAAQKYEVRSQAAQDIRPSLSRLAGEQGWILLGMQQEERSLEDVFQNLTK